MERTLYHVTRRTNLPSILRQGLQPARSKTVWPTIWICSEEAIEDMMQHMTRRHGCSRKTLVVIRVQVDARRLRRNRAPGVYHYPHEISVKPEDVFLWSGGGLHQLNV